MREQLRKLLIALSVFFLIISIALLFPTVKFSLIDENREVIHIGTSSITVGDAILIFSLLAASADVMVLITLMREGKNRRKNS